MIVSISTNIPLALARECIPNVSASSVAREDLYVTPALPDSIPHEPLSLKRKPKIVMEGTLDEIDDWEGSNPLYVLVFGDDDVSDNLFYIVWQGLKSWDVYTKFQIERGDEPLISNFGIDIRIIDIKYWDTSDASDSMYEIFDELETETQQYLGQWYEGPLWSDYVDVVIGITDQPTPADDPQLAGLAGWNFVLIKWKGIYWSDDNLVAHEVSHLFGAPDHYDGCCMMATHKHFQSVVVEDTVWGVVADVPCLYTSNYWCAGCFNTISTHRCDFQESGFGFSGLIVEILCLRLELT